MLRILTIGLLLVLALASCASPSVSQPATDSDSDTVKVFKTPDWGCCGDWSDYVAQNGFEVTVEDVSNPAALKAKYQIPAELQSCHTATVGGYVIEGHVPVADIERLLNEKPDVIGLAVPGMPIGSPGMEVEGAAPEAYEVIAFDKTGNMEVFSSYNP